MELTIREALPYDARMSSSLDNDSFPSDKDDDLLQGCLEDPSLASLTRIDSKEQSISINLDAVRQSILRSLSASPSTFLQDKILLDSLPLASKLLIESFEETEKALTSDSIPDVESKLTLWQNSLEPWHEFLKHVKNLGSVPSRSIKSLLDFLPEIIQTIFSHCKRSKSLYGQKFNDLLPQITALFRQTDNVLKLFFSILETTVKFDEISNEKNILNTVLDKIGDIAVLTYGMGLKTLLSTWKTFEKLAMVYDSTIKTSGSTECITRRYSDVAKDIQTLLHDSFRDKKETNYEKSIKCAGLLLEILDRLCKFYRGYCENKVFDALVQLLTKLYRYSPPFAAQRIVNVHSKIYECSEKHIFPTTVKLLNTLVEDKEFRKAFFEYGKSEAEEQICYHILTLRIIEELIKRQQSDLSSWLREDGNIVEIALANVNNCCEDFLINDLRVSIRPEVISGELQQLGIYEVTLRLLYHFVARTSAEEFEAVEITLLRHLLSGELWSSLICCDLWTCLGRIASSKLCFEQLSFLLKIQKNLITREKSFEFEILSNLIGRLYKLLPEEMKECLFREVGDYSNRRLIDPLRESLPARAKQYLSRQPSIDMTINLALVFQDLQSCPSVKNWKRLTSLLESIGAVANRNDERMCIVTLQSIWQFNASSISKAQGVTRDMLLELTALLLDCTQADAAKNSNNDGLIASIYKSMMQITEHVPPEHRIKMNVFLRDNLESYVNECGNQSLPAITELFCYLMNDENPLVHQEWFETYTEHILNVPSAQIFDNLSLGISKHPHLCQQMSSYLSNKQIHAFRHHESLENYLRHLAEISRDRSSWHKCYEPDFRQRDEKMPRIETTNIDKRVADICEDLQEIVTKKNELNNTSTDRLRAILLQLLEP